MEGYDGDQIDEAFTKKINEAKLRDTLIERVDKGHYVMAKDFYVNLNIFG